jgi:hypothetical protein
MLKFIGNYGKLKTRVSRAGLSGKWRTLRYGQKQYRTVDGGILNWWERLGLYRFKVRIGQLGKDWRGRLLHQQKSIFWANTVGTFFAGDCGAYMRTHEATGLHGFICSLQISPQSLAQ